MTNVEFELIAKQMHQSACRSAVRLVLVEGIAASEAAALHGLSRSSVSNAIARVRETHAWAKLVAKIKLSDER